MTYEPDDIANVRLPLISLFLLVALPVALIPVLQFLSISAAGSGADTAGTTGALSLAAQPGSVVAGSIIGLLIAYVIGGRKTMFLAVLSIVVAVAAMLSVGSPATFQWGRTTLNLGAGALLVLPILILGHYGSHRQIAAGMPGLILGPFILVALVGLLTRPGAEDRIAAITKGLGGIEPMGWLAIVLTLLLVLSLFRAMGRARGGRPNALFSAELRADARIALGFVLTGPQIYALLIAMALAGHAATFYLGDFTRKSPLEGFGIGSTIAATLCLGLGGFLIARIFGPRRRQHVLATTIVFLFITAGLMVATDIMFAPPTTGSLGIFVWPYTPDQLVLLVLTCAAMAMLGAAFAMIWLAIVEVGIGALATILLVTVLVARIGAPVVVPLLPIPEMWLATGLLGAALVLVALGTLFGRRVHNPAPQATSGDYDPIESAGHAERHDHLHHDEPGFGTGRNFDADPEPEIKPTPVPDPEPEPEPVFEDEPVPPPAQHAPVTPPATPAPQHELTRPEPPAAPQRPAPREPFMPDTPEEPPASSKTPGGLPWRRRRTKHGERDAPASSQAEPRKRTEPPARVEPSVQTKRSKRADPSHPAAETPVRPAEKRHEAVQDTHIDWAKLGATVVNDELVPPNTPAPDDDSDVKRERRTAPDSPPMDKPEEATERRTETDSKPAADVTAGDGAQTDGSNDGPTNPPEPAQPAARPQPAEPAFTRHESTAFDFDRLRDNTHTPDEPSDQPDEEKE